MMVHAGVDSYVQNVTRCGHSQLEPGRPVRPQPVRHPFQHQAGPVN